jgi:hypothetical protein
LPIRVEAYTADGIATGMVDRAGSLRDSLEGSSELAVLGAQWLPLDGSGERSAGDVVVPIDDLLLAVGEAGEAPVHAQWHDVELDAGPYRLRGEMPTLPGFDPGRALARPTGEFVLLRDARIELIGQPDAGEASCLEILVNRYTVDRVRADLMLGFFFPGAHIEVTGHVASDHTDSVLAAVPSATPAADPGVPPAS